MAGAKALLIVAIAGCICLCSTTVLAARELGDDAAMAARHEQWMAQHGRVYKDSTEKAYRLGVFKANVAFIESFNAAGDHKFWLGVNQFTDLTNDEFRETRTNRGIIKQDGVVRAKDLVTGREIWLPAGNRVSRAPTVIGVTEQKISNLFEFFEFERTTLYK
jgi:hypothetical protein